ncbi:MAG: MarR family transcriptional regulator [Burkholderiales bacterium]|nr:MAG: MarR family transcriptional regulator [Burkholderiales bacterium]
MKELDFGDDVLSTPGHLISLAARSYARLSERRLKPLGFGVGQLPILVALQERQGMSQQALARFARIEQPSMAQTLARMERDGLVERKADPADRRSSQVVLTADAMQRLPRACAELFSGNRESLYGFSAAEAGQLTDMLARLILNLDRILEEE